MFMGLRDANNIDISNITFTSVSEYLFYIKFHQQVVHAF